MAMLAVYTTFIQPHKSLYSPWVRPRRQAVSATDISWSSCTQLPCPTATLFPDRQRQSDVPDRATSRPDVCTARFYNDPVESVCLSARDRDISYLLPTTPSRHHRRPSHTYTYTTPPRLALNLSQSVPISQLNVTSEHEFIDFPVNTFLNFEGCAADR